jgi:hypothetical protein
VTDRSKRQKGSPEGAAKDAAKPAVLDRLAKKGSVFDRLESGKKAALVDAKAELLPVKADVTKKVRLSKTWYGILVSLRVEIRWYSASARIWTCDIHLAQPDPCARWL